MKRRGFTIIELIIVITVMGILLVLGVVNLRGSQANGYDSERKTDIETIGAHLETYYQSGTDGLGTTLTKAIGSYPSTDLISHETTLLRDLDTKSITAPDTTSTPANTFMAAANSVQTTTGISPQPTKNQYIYQPIDSSGGLCQTTEECRKFNLYYRLETDDTVYMVTSKNQ